MDLCCGSGSGLIAGLRLGYNVAGFDIKEAQVNAAKARIREFSKQEVCLIVPHTVSSESICLLTACSHNMSCCHVVIAFVGRSLQGLCSEAGIWLPRVRVRGGRWCNIGSI